MSMSAKDFKALAEALKQHRIRLDQASAENCDNMLDMAMDDLVQSIADICTKHNPLFDRRKFVQATEES